MEEPNLPAVCDGCGYPYSKAGFADLLIPTYIWTQISPTVAENGLLCPCCIIERLEEKGMSNVPAAFMSGPLRMVDPELLSLMLKSEEQSKRFKEVLAKLPKPET